MSDDLLIDERPVRRRFYSRWLGGALGPGRDRHWLWRLLKWLGLALLAVIVLYYPGGMMLTHEINDDPNFSAGPGGQTASAGQRPSQAGGPPPGAVGPGGNPNPRPAHHPLLI